MKKAGRQKKWIITKEVAATTKAVGSTAAVIQDLTGHSTAKDARVAETTTTGHPTGRDGRAATMARDRHIPATDLYSQQTGLLMERDHPMEKGLHTVKDNHTVSRDHAEPEDSDHAATAISITAAKAHSTAEVRDGQISAARKAAAQKAVQQNRASRKDRASSPSRARDADSSRRDSPSLCSATKTRAA